MSSFYASWKRDVFQRFLFQAETSSTSSIHGLYRQNYRWYLPASKLKEATENSLQRCGSELRSEVVSFAEKLKNVVEFGQNASVLVVGPRGSGKSLFLSHAVDLAESSLCSCGECDVALSSKRRLAVVRSFGSLHKDPVHALRDIVNSTRVALNSAETISTLTSFDETFSCLKRILRTAATVANRCGGTIGGRGLLLVLEEAESYLQGTQLLLYSLFDLMHTEDIHLACLVFTRMSNFGEFLEKRIRSRFSLQCVFLRGVSTINLLEGLLNSILLPQRHQILHHINKCEGPTRQTNTNLMKFEAFFCVVHDTIKTAISSVCKRSEVRLLSDLGTDPRRLLLRIVVEILTSAVFHPKSLFASMLDQDKEQLRYSSTTEQGFNSMQQTHSTRGSTQQPPQHNLPASPAISTTDAKKRNTNQEAWPISYSSTSVSIDDVKMVDTHDDTSLPASSVLMSPRMSSTAHDDSALLMLEAYRDCLSAVPMPFFSVVGLQSHINNVAIKGIIDGQQSSAQMLTALTLTPSSHPVRNQRQPVMSCSGLHALSGPGPDAVSYEEHQDGNTGSGCTTKSAELYPKAELDSAQDKTCFYSPEEQIGSSEEDKENVFHQKPRDDGCSLTTNHTRCQTNDSTPSRYSRDSPPVKLPTSTGKDNVKCQETSAGTQTMSSVRTGGTRRSTRLADSKTKSTTGGPRGASRSTAAVADLMDIDSKANQLSENAVPLISAVDVSTPVRYTGRRCRTRNASTKRKYVEISGCTGPLESSGETESARKRRRTAPASPKNTRRARQLANNGTDMILRSRRSVTSHNKPVAESVAKPVPVKTEPVHTRAASARRAAGGSKSQLPELQTSATEYSSLGFHECSESVAADVAVGVQWVGLPTKDDDLCGSIEEGVYTTLLSDFGRCELEVLAAMSRLHRQSVTPKTLAIVLQSLVQLQNARRRRPGLGSQSGLIGFNDAAYCRAFQRLKNLGVIENSAVPVGASTQLVACLRRSQSRMALLHVPARFPKHQSFYKLATRRNSPLRLDHFLLDWLTALV
eukprot:Lankesteria_metandrocarpae@DN4838_c0_g1_i1.p1